MINYDSRDWLRGLTQVRREDTVRTLAPLIVTVCLYTAFIVFVECDWLHLPESSPLKQFGILHTLLGFVISMLLVFRTNTAYDRWWEGRKQWGTLTNNCRNFAIKINAFVPPQDIKNRTFFTRLLPFFARALQRHLLAETTRLALDTEPHPEIPEFDQTQHVPNQVAAVIAAKLNRMYQEGSLTGDQFIIINAELQALLDVCGACERIKNTPIPYSYSTFIKKFIFMYVLTLPIGLAFMLHYGAVPVVGLVFYVLGSLELIAEEIEDPFGNDSNDLPMGKIADNIRKNVEQIIHS